MEIDDVIDILYDGNEKQMKNIIKSEKISYKFSKNLQSYTITNGKTFESVRGYKSHYKPNCINYLGYECSYTNI